MSGHPFVPGSGNNPQGLNRYAYVFNNPLRYTDPDGFKPFWKKQWFMTVAAVAASIYTVGAVSGWMANYAAYSSAYGTTAFATATLDVASGVLTTSLSTAGFAAAGPAGGFMGGLVASGGNLEAAFSGAVTGAAFGWAGSPGSTGEIMTGHAAAGCLSGVVQGGGCGRGAMSAVVGKAVTLGIGGPSTGQNGARKFVAATVAGGISSKVAGGNFAAGATTAAFGYLFNECNTRGCWVNDQERALFKAGQTVEGYQLMCSNGDAYGCEASLVAANKGFRANLTNARLETSLVAEGAAGNRVEAQGLMGLIRIDLGNAYVDHLDALGGRSDNPV